MIVGLFHRRITWRATSNLCARLRLSFFIILFRQAEIDKHRTAIGLKHHICWLEVQMQHLLAVHVLQTFSNTSQTLQRRSLIHAPMFADEAVKASASHKLHDIIDRVVLFKRLKHMNDVRMVY